MSRNFTSLCLVAITTLLPFPVRAEESRIDDLVASLTVGSEGTRTQAAVRLYHLDQGDRGVGPMARQLRSEDPDERCLAARLLGMLRSRRAIAPLSAALNDEEWAVRRDVAESLGQIGDASTAPRLTRLLADPHPRVRIAAIRSLRELGVATSLPRALTEEEETEVRLHLVEALGADLSVPATTALHGVLDDDSELVRLLAASFLVERGDVAAVEMLAARLSLESPTVRREAAEALGRATGPAASAAREALTPRLGDADPEVALSAAASLMALGDRRGAEYLRGLARSAAPPPLRARALELLEATPSSTPP